MNLFQGVTQVGHLDGTDYYNTSSFMNITASNPGEWFNRIEFASPSTYFEIDNMATRLTTMREPSPIGILAIGLAALAWRRVLRFQPGTRPKRV
ncbi:MAG: PEP-CTERM sorting domain-containing protein [Betaproteobacteria bacterium]|nr:PEP-CTERM sorting domain-containing protein [Betaproteobacteria bacterium]